MLIKGYSEVSIARAGVRNDITCDLRWGAHFKLSDDVQEVFPYINGELPEARYHHRPPHIGFERNAVQCTLYPQEAIAAPFRGRDHAYEFIEELLVFLNELHERRHEVTPSHKTHREPASMVDLLKALPRTNCRKCGYATCMAFAAALRGGQAAPADCPDFAKPIAVHTIYPIFGPDGAMKSTIAVESDGAAAVLTGEKRKTNATKPLIVRQVRQTQKTPLYDHAGIRIQYDLTPREIQVLRLIAEGASNPEISKHLHISPHTVKSHVIHIFNKLNVNDRTLAAVWAVRNQII